MKIKSFITFSLLLAVSFSIVHEYAFAFYDDQHCNTAEYVQELQGPVTLEAGPHESSGHTEDICDIHFEYHQAFLLLPVSSFFQDHDLRSPVVLTKETYLFQTHLKSIKPPIV